MEAVGAASSIAGLVSLSGTILAKGYAFLGSVHRAPKELRELLSESAALAAVLDQIQTLAEDRQDEDAVGRALTRIAEAGALEECNVSLLFVDNSIRRCQQIDGHKFSNAGKKLLWPFQEKETKDGVARLARLTSYLSTALTTDMAKVLNDVRVVSQQNAQGIADLQTWTLGRDRTNQRREIRHWLEPNSINVEDNLRAALKQQHPGTGGWLFELPAFKAWETGESSVLWIHGIPGSGKTVLASSIISQFLQRQSRLSDTVVYFFCDQRDANKRTWQDFLSSAILQLVRQMPDLEDEVLLMFEHCGGSGTRPIHVQDQLILLERLIQRVQSLHIIIDALDESKGVEDSMGPQEHKGPEEYKGPEEFAKGLEHLLMTGGEFVPIRILVTSRNDYALERTVGILSSHRIDLNQHITGDISKFVISEVKRRIEGRILKIRSPALQDEVISVLTERAQGMFIWATLQLDLISRLTTDKSISESLLRLPHGINSTYFRLLEQVVERNPENAATVVKALSWLTSVTIPITLGQLVEAISIDPGDTNREPEKIMTDGRDLLQILGSLVAVDSTKLDPVVSLTHHTLYEFLTSNELRTHGLLSHFFVPASFSADIGITCLQYLSFSDFESPCRDEEQLEERQRSFRFLSFAALCFDAQIEAVGGMAPRLTKGRDFLKLFLKPGFDAKQNFTSWQQIYYDEVDVSHYSQDPLQYMEHSLDFSSYNSLFLEALMPDLLCSQGYSPLHTAAIIGKEQDARVILGQRPELLETRSPSGHTALHFAAMYGHAGIVGLLLKRGASIDARNNSGSTPFYHAARSGCVRAMDLLYQAGSEINPKTWDDWTPIFEAIENQHIIATEWLVKHGADLKQAGVAHMTALEFARIYGNTSIIAIIEQGNLE